MHPCAAIFCVGVILCASAEAAAASRATCERYARDAVNVQIVNQRDHCELVGDPWSLNERDHFN